MAAETLDFARGRLIDGSHARRRFLQRLLPFSEFLRLDDRPLPTQTFLEVKITIQVVPLMK